MRSIAGDIGANLRRLRRDRGLSSSELARTSGVAKNTLSQLELGRGNPTVETLFAISRALGVPLGALLEDQRLTGVHVTRAEPSQVVRGTSVDLRFVHRGAAGDGIFELYAMSVRPAVQLARAHAGGVFEHVLLETGRLRVGPIGEEVELGPGDFASFPADVEHVYEGLVDLCTGTLLITYPRLPVGAADAAPTDELLGTHQD